MSKNLDWNTEDSLKLLDLYEKHSVLWNPRHCYYYNKNKKQKAWELVSRACEVPIAEVKRKMDSLLSSFRRERCKVRKKQKAMDEGDGTRHREYVSRWFAFKKMSFLLDKEDPKEFIDYDDDISLQDGVQQVTGDAMRPAEDSLLFSVEAVYDPDPTVVTDLEESSGASNQLSTFNDYKLLQRDCDRPKNPSQNQKVIVPFKMVKSIKRSASDSEDDSMLDTDQQQSTRIDIGQQQSTRMDIGQQQSTRMDIGQQQSTRMDVGQQESTRMDISKAVDILKSAAARVRVGRGDDCSTYGEHVANKLRGYDKRTRDIVEYHINSIMFQADMGEFENTTKLSMQSTYQVSSQRNVPHGSVDSSCNLQSTSSELE